MHNLIWLIAIAYSIFAAWMDWKTRKIPNWLTLPGVLGGLLLNTAFWGWAGFKTALIGALLALGVLLPLVIIRGLGGGDWKLMGALGSLLGWGPALLVLLASILVAGLFALVQSIRERRFISTLSNLWEIVRGIFVYGLNPHPVLSLDNPRAMTVPFGVAAALGTILCYGALIVRVGKLSWG